MANIIIAGNAAVITSAITAENIGKLKKYDPSALKLKDDKDHVVFMIDMGDVASVSNAGIIFDGVSRDGNGFATATLGIGSAVNAKEYVMDKIGFSILHLNELEKQINDSVSAINSKLDSVENTITVYGEETPGEE